VTITATRSIETVEHSAVVARAGGLPVIAAYEVGDRRVVAFGFDAASDAAGDVMFPLLIAETVEWLAGSDSFTLESGGVLRVAGLDGEVAIVGPDGQDVPHVRSGNAIVASKTARAGIYRVNIAGRELRFAVNPATEGESDLSNSPTAVVPSSSPPVVAAASGIGLATVLLFIGLAVLAVEWRLLTRTQVA
jgi:hypothetical protein